MVDMAHFAGLVAGDAYPTPLPHATRSSRRHTQQTLRGPRGGLILGNDEEIARRINAAVFPGCRAVADACDRRQGGRAARGFAACVQAIRECGCGKREASCHLDQAGLEIVSGGTDSHLMLVNLRSMGITGRDAEKSLERAGVTCNKNAIRSTGKAYGDLGRPSWLGGGNDARLRTRRVSDRRRCIVETLAVRSRHHPAIAARPKPA